MNHVSTRFFAPCAMTGLLLLVASLFMGNQLSAQTASPTLEASTSVSSFLWKDQATMQQIVQQEITETDVSLAKPNLTDWSTAMLEAYKSFLAHTQANMQGAKDMGMGFVLDQAYAWIKNESVLNAAVRLMVLDDMKAKQVELTLKLTFN